MTGHELRVADRRPVRGVPICDDCAAREKDADTAARGVAPHPVTLEDWLASHGVNTRKHGAATLTSFDAKDSPVALDAARRFVEDTVLAGRHDRVRGLYLVGPTGVGKSHLAVAIMRAVHEADPAVSVLYDPADRLVTRVQDSYGTGTTDALIEARQRAGLYVLDDLGREKGTADALRVLCTVLDEREGSPTVITANATPAQLGARFGDESMWARVESRLGDAVFQYVALHGTDRRFQEAG